MVEEPIDSRDLMSQEPIYSKTFKEEKTLLPCFVVVFRSNVIGDNMGMATH